VVDSGHSMGSDELRRAFHHCIKPPSITAV